MKQTKGNQNKDLWKSQITKEQLQAAHGEFGGHHGMWINMASDIGYEIGKYIPWQTIRSLYYKLVEPEPSRYSSNRQRDSQRSKVYKWERGFFYNTYEVNYIGDNKLSLEKCQELVNHIYRTFDILPPKVKEGRYGCSAWANEFFISLPSWARTKPIVIHECSHGLTDMWFPGSAGHGVEYVGIFYKLISIFMHIDELKLKKSLVKNRIRHITNISMIDKKDNLIKENM